MPSCPFSFLQVGTRVYITVAQGGAIVRGEHTMYMIVEARVRHFMQPFAMASQVDIYPAATCAGVVSNGGCGAARPDVDPTVPALDPEDACQWVIDGGLVVHRAHRLNCETSLPALVGGVVMPNASFYIRNHFQIPKLDPAAWRLSVGGLVDRPLRLSLRDLTTYFFEWPRDGRLVREPVTLQRVRSLITEPEEGADLERGELAIRGVAWSGAAPIARVDVSASAMRLWRRVHPSRIRVSSVPSTH